MAACGIEHTPFDFQYKAVLLEATQIPFLYSQGICTGWPQIEQLESVQVQNDILPLPGSLHGYQIPFQRQ